MVAPTSVRRHEVMLSHFSSKCFFSCYLLKRGNSALHCPHCRTQADRNQIWNFNINCGRGKEGLMPAVKHTEPEVDMVISAHNSLVRTSHLSSPKDKEVGDCEPTMCPKEGALMTIATSSITLKPLCPWGSSQLTPLLSPSIRENKLLVSLL